MKNNTVFQEFIDFVKSDEYAHLYECVKNEWFNTFMEKEKIQKMQHRAERYQKSYSFLVEKGILQNDVSLDDIKKAISIASGISES